jgi:hypothetical protein
VGHTYAIAHTRSKVGSQAEVYFSKYGKEVNRSDEEAEEVR